MIKFIVVLFYMFVIIQLNYVYLDPMPYDNHTFLLKLLCSLQSTVVMYTHILIYIVHTTNDYPMGSLPVWGGGYLIES